MTTKCPKCGYELNTIGNCPNCGTQTGWSWGPRSMTLRHITLILCLLAAFSGFRGRTC